MTVRFRSSGAFTNQSYSTPWYDWQKISCSGDPVRKYRGMLSSNEWIGERRTMTDFVVPNFRKRIASGEIIMNRMSSRHTIINPAELSGAPWIFYGNFYNCSSPATYRVLYELSPEYFLTEILDDFTPVSNEWKPRTLLSSGEYENAIDEASTRCHSERGRSPVNLWEALAERKKTYELLAVYGEQLKKITIDMRREVDSRHSKFNKLIRSGNLITTSAAGTWLISRYGLFPLMKDIKVLMMQLSKTLDDAERFTTRGKSVVERYSSSLIDRSSIDAHVMINGSYAISDSVNVRAMSIDEWRVTMADHFGLGYKGLIELPYQLFHLSFVADWFVNGSDFIGSIIPTPNVVQRGSCIVVTRTQTATLNLSGSSGKAISTVTSSPSLTKIGTVVDKVRNPGLRTPKLLVLNRNKIDPDLDKNNVRIVDAFALVGQRLRGISTAILGKLIHQPVKH